MEEASIEQASANRVLVVGELLADLISEKNIASLAFSSNFNISQGGSSANLCANLKWLGIDAQLVGCVGDDGLGTYLINEIKSTGLSDQYLKRLPNHQTSMVLVGKNTGTPDFIPYRSADLQIGEIEQELIDGAVMIHTTAFALSKEPAKGNILNALKEANRLGKQVSIDWNYAPSIWNTDDAHEIFNQICGFKPLIKISLDDIERFFGQKLSIEASIKQLDHLKAAVICLTCGKDGVWFKKANGIWLHKAALPINNIASVTGAGDAFWSGFLCYFIHDKAVEACVDYALAIAKDKIENFGPLYKTRTTIINNQPN